ncbi:hypothetical protein LIZ76_11715 [Caldibacillus sp. 210928-DFI.2.22]|uniref:hypothetical protein n=1 Tax=Caldibacillus sp. 210928-DFI.2.18 TaxID=2883264 RepID=UPI001D0747FB|nr:hypothetical protein [Caldibacillus sp. 210928-DFI.2.18]MCB7070638.1 hypothetical protein [Caldibacillus sp. 210928-DFI.2.22]MCB7074196.1 hypothetical protein [Caldibacillus sp. 210928-DFI.2.18]
MPYFGDETESRHLFWVKNSIFWRRASISSPFLSEKSSILTTEPDLVTILRRQTPYFADKTTQSLLVAAFMGLTSLS